jgi:uncharacterized membrane protein (UPF0136 family)
MNINPNIILWIYIVLLVLGGVMGYMMAGSKISIIMAACFAAALSLCAAKIIVVAHLEDILLAALLIVFAWRLTRTKKFIPSGLMLVLTIAVLASRHVDLHRLGL